MAGRPVPGRVAGDLALSVVRWRRDDTRTAVRSVASETRWCYGFPSTAGSADQKTAASCRGGSSSSMKRSD